MLKTRLGGFKAKAQAFSGLKYGERCGLGAAAVFQGKAGRHKGGKCCWLRWCKGLVGYGGLSVQGLMFGLTDTKFKIKVLGGGSDVPSESLKSA